MTFAPRTIAGWLLALLLLSLPLLSGCGKGRPAPARIGSGPPLAWGQEPTKKKIQRAKSGPYVVQPGDSLYAIAVVHEVEAADLARWNKIDDPDLLFVGQKLWLAPPDGAKPEQPEWSSPAPRPVQTASATDADDETPAPHAAPRSANSRPAETVAEGSGAEASQRTEQTVSPRYKLPAAAPGQWQWPHGGHIIQTFGQHGQTRSTGIDIAARPGDRVRAASDGVVAYADDGLPAYGNLVILRHGGSYMTAYAHNEAILVKRGERVQAGQVIAKAGASGRAASPRLHFELRKGVTPLDPLHFLPRRTP